MARIFKRQSAVLSTGGLRFCRFTAWNLRLFSERSRPSGLLQLLVEAGGFVGPESRPALPDHFQLIGVRLRSDANLPHHPSHMLFVGLSDQKYLARRWVFGVDSLSMALLPRKTSHVHVLNTSKSSLAGHTGPGRVLPPRSRSGSGSLIKLLRRRLCTWLSAL